MESEVGIRIGLSLLNNLNELAVDHREEVDSSGERNMGGRASRKKFHTLQSPEYERHSQRSFRPYANFFCANLQD
jgi:hypothetical protein